MNLVIDIGNTRIKAALFEGNKLHEFKFYPLVADILADSDFLKQAKHAIIGSVVAELQSFYEALNALVPTMVFTSQTKIPLLNLYQSASTLGSDRLAASVGAYYLHPNTNVLVIDAGTCIKYNFTNVRNEYLGGGISPGIQMKFKALQHFTSKLPLVEADFSYDQLIGTNTQSSLLSGVLNGSVAEIDGIITAYTSQFTDTICILTGGDSQYLAKRLKNSIFAHQNLVLKGLNDILNYTLENT
ncbi:MAG: type III pantothenate kinase [Bacteroidetes bacterium]|nr:type III pantothenate kinase [Bacteroidota bacterium]